MYVPECAVYTGTLNYQIQLSYASYHYHREAIQMPDMLVLKIP